MSATVSQPALPFRAHTILGVCEGIGEDFGFNPLFLRAPLAAVVLVSPILAIGTYFALGLIVLAARLIFPQPTAIVAGSSGASIAAAPAPAEYKLAA